MASPFEIFRKNQRLWMAGAVFVAVVAFVIAPMLETLIGTRGGNGQGPNPVIASWNGGAIRMQQIERDQGDLSMVNRFLRELATAVIAKGGMPAVPGFSADLSTLGVTPSVSPDAIIQRHLFCTEAAKLGIHFDDGAVKHFLRRFVDGRLSGSEIQALMTKSTERKLTMPLFSRVLKDELCYQELRRLTNSGLVFVDIKNGATVGYPFLTTPSKNWREYLKVSQKADIKAYPVVVRDYLEQVTATPSDQELRSIYDAGKQIVRYEGMLETTPAFMHRATANLEFATIDLEGLIAQEVAKLSEDKIREEYEIRVIQNQFRVPVEPTPPAAPAPSTEPASEAITNESNGTAPNSVPETPAAPETPAEPTQASENAPTEAPVESAPAAENPQSSSAPAPSQVRLVAYQEESEGTPSPVTSAETTEPVTPATPEPPAAPSEPSVPETARTEQDGPAPLELNPPQSEEPTAELPATGLTIGEQPMGLPGLPPAVPPTPMRTQAFDEVREIVARDLARVKAMEIASERIEQLYSAMRVYQSELSTYESLLKQPGAPKAERPTRPDLEELAKEFHLDYGTTGTVDSKSVMLSPIGSSMLNVANAGMRQQQPEGVDILLDKTFGVGATFVPLTSTAQLGQKISLFVFWKTELQQPETPTYEAVKDEVIEVWKHQEAQKLAEAKARELASKIGGGQIEDVLSTEEEKKQVVKPTPFTAISPMYPMYLQLNMGDRMNPANDVDLLNPVDLSFMDTVFGAKPDEAVVAPDARRSVYYVIKLLGTSPSDEELMKSFQASPKETVRSLVTQENNQAIQSYRVNILERLGFRQYEIPGFE